MAGNPDNVYLEMVHRWFFGQVMLEHMKRERANLTGSEVFEWNLARADLKRSVAKLEDILKQFPAFKDDCNMWSGMDEKHKNTLLRIVKSKLAGSATELNEGV